MRLGSVAVNGIYPETCVACYNRDGAARGRRKPAFTIMLLESKSPAADSQARYLAKFLVSTINRVGGWE